jgi:hypothetical protein
MKQVARLMLCLLAGGLITTTASAANVYSTSSGVQVKFVSVEACSQDDCAGQVFVTFTPKPLTTTCSQDASGYYRIGGDAESRESMRSAAIAAKLAGAPVQIAWNNSGGASSCTSSGYPIVRVIKLL